MTDKAAAPEGIASGWHPLLHQLWTQAFLNRYEEPVWDAGPFPWHSVLKVLGDVDVQNVVRGDGSRRRCAEVRAGLRTYKRWLNSDEALWSFAVYLFADVSDEYPAFDLADYLMEHIAYRPPRLTVDYSTPPKGFDSIAGDTFGWSDNGGRGRVRLSVDVNAFGKHRRWQELIGEKSPNHKLTEPKVVEIRERYAAGGVSMASLAKEFGVTQATVNGIVWGSLWIYAPGPVKCRQLLRARCTTSTAYLNKYGERTRSEDHPKPEALTDGEASVIDHCERQREEDRYVSIAERRAWRKKMPIEYEWGIYDPRESATSDDAVAKGSPYCESSKRESSNSFSS